MDDEQPKFRILMFPWLAYSHVFPFLELAKRLSKKNFHIYFCSSLVNLDLIRKNNFHKDSSDSIELIQLQIASSPDLPPQFQTTKNLPPNLLPILLDAFQTSSSSFSEILKSLKPDLLIYDFFQPWAPNMALTQGIPSVYFATSGASPFSFFHHHHTHGNYSTFPYQELYLLDHEKAALIPHIKAKPKIMDANHEEFSLGIFKSSCDIVLARSSRRVEGKYIDYLSSLCQKKVVPTSPLVQDPLDNDSDEFSDIMEWLSTKDQFSTVFICFGSEHFLSKEQILEISKGLVLCDANFIWAIRFPTNESMKDLLSQEFLEKVKERGMLVEGWVPQAKILSHPSIGGFLSHCGWSSVMESLYFGVPVLAMPLKFDQPINGRLAMASGVGVEVGKGQNGDFSGEELAKAINMVIVEKGGEGLRYRARKLSEEMRREAEEEVNEAAHQLLEICIKYKQKLMGSIPSSCN